MKVNNSVEFGKLIKERRKKLKYTQSYVSDFSGLSVSFISDVEKGKPTIEFEKALKLASLLGLNMIMEERN